MLLVRPVPWTAALGLLIGSLFFLGGCSSGQQLESIQSQLADLQRQILQLQRQSPTKEDIELLRQEVARQREALLKTEADQGVRLEALEGMIERLETGLDDSTEQLARLAQQLAATNQELKAARTSAPTFGAGASGDRPGVSGQDPESLYRAAYNDYLRGNYDLAIQQFQEYIGTFPEADLADNAAYWLGECFYRQEKYRLAIGEFDNLLDRYPRSDKIPSALLKKAYAFLELNERSQGIVQLQHVIREYPSSDESNLARQRLRELGVDGG
ncbi:MAG: tol-pal system protein YbgF [Acidobacteria bacterium]|nr:tol-pal system protein YbgF [Acidobacteriota bacterium]